jgi:hypothetical protein
VRLEGCGYNKLFKHMLAGPKVSKLVSDNTLGISLLLIGFRKIVRNEILPVHCMTHNAVIPLYKSNARSISEHSR